MSPGSPRHFAVFRILLASFLAGQLATWWPWATELFSSEGLPALAGPGLGSIFPSPLPAGPATTHAFLAGMALLTLALGLGVARRAAALALWWAWACLGHAAPHTQTVASGFVGWLLLATALVPPGEPLRPLRARRQGGDVPRALWVGAWVVLAAGYGVAGLDKLASPGWRAGDALAAAVGLPYARDATASLLLALPRSLQHLATWTGLGIELAFPLLALARPTRALAWASGVALQLALLLLFAFPGLTVGMLLMHAFTFDPRWLGERRRPG